MHYYQFNIGDYASHTKHLTPEEDITYRRLIDLYYLHEEPLANDAEKLSRLIGMNGRSTVVEQTLNEFFTLVDGRWNHSRINDEIDAFFAKKKQAVEAGKASARARSERKVNGRSTDAQPTINHKPLTINHKTLTSKSYSSADTDTEKNSETETQSDDENSVDDVPEKKRREPDTIPYDEIQKLYNEICVSLPFCSGMTQKRRIAVKGRWNSKSADGSYKRQNLDWWKKFFSVVEASDWLTGRNKEGWKVPAFEWLVNETNFMKIIEGSYTNRKQGAGR